MSIVTVVFDLCQCAILFCNALQSMPMQILKHFLLILIQTLTQTPILTLLQSPLVANLTIFALIPHAILQAILHGHFAPFYIDHCTEEKEDRRRKESDVSPSACDSFANLPKRWSVFLHVESQDICKY